MAAAVVTPQVDAFELPTTSPVAELHASLAKPASDPTDKRDAQAKPLVAEVKPAAPQPMLPDAPEPAIHDASGAAPLSPPVQATSPASAALPTSALPTPVPPADTLQPAAPSGAPAALVSPQVHAAATPAAQIAPVLVSMAHAPDGAQRLTLRLDPPELGHVQIRIDRPQDAPARVDITVERAETLTLLLRDQPQLQRALDQAGVPSDGRSVTIHVAATESAARPDGGPAASQGMGSAGTGDATYGTPRQGGQQARNDTGNADEAEGELAQIVLPGWLRGGLDITA
jgi:chemotaxis protein MotD